MSLDFNDDSDEAPLLVDFGDTTQAEAIEKVPITIVTGYLGAGSMSKFPANVSDSGGEYRL